MDRSRLRLRTLRGASLVSLVLVSVLGFASSLGAAYNAPAGYEAIDLGLSVPAFGVSANGRLVTATVTGTSATITLYDTWKPGRSVLKSATLNASFPFLTDLGFVGEDRVVFGENGPTDSLWTVDFSATTPAPAQLSASGAFPNVQGVAVTPGGASVLVSGTTAPFGQTGGLYLSRYTLAGGGIAPIASNAGSGYAGGPGVTPTGSSILLDSAFAAGSVLRYDGTTNAALSPINLGAGGGSGAYAIAFDSAGVAYVTTGDRITRVSGIDGGAASVGGFGSFVLPGEFPFLTGIAFTGGDFRAGYGNDTGALISNNGGFTTADGLFAIVPVPEPAAVAVIAFGVFGLLARRNRGVARAMVMVMAVGFFAGISQPVNAAQFFATSASAVPGADQSGSFADVNMLLGGPRGDPGGVQHVYNTGVSGSVTLGFNDGATQRAIFDGPGADLIVFENSFTVGSNVFAELVFVEVSTNGTDFARFPVVSNTPSNPGPFGTTDPANVSGFGGVHPVAANVDTNAINPFDPAVAGGDAFDLSALASHPLVTAGTVNLQQIRFVRLVDVIGDGTLFDDQLPAKAIFDPTGSGNNGADLDALAVINGTVVPEPAALGVLGFVMLLGFRRTR